MKILEKKGLLNTRRKSLNTNTSCFLSELSSKSCKTWLQRKKFIPKTIVVTQIKVWQLLQSSLPVVYALAVVAIKPTCLMFDIVWVLFSCRFRDETEFTKVIEVNQLGNRQLEFIPRFLRLISAWKFCLIAFTTSAGLRSDEMTLESSFLSCTCTLYLRTEERCPKCGV